MSPVLAGGFFTTEPPGNLLTLSLFIICVSKENHDSRQLRQMCDLYCYKNIHLVSGYTETTAFLQSFKEELASMYK